MRAVFALALMISPALAQTPGWQPSCEVLPWERVTPQHPKGFSTKSYLKNHNSRATTKRLTTRLITIDRVLKGPDRESAPPAIAWQFRRNEYELCHRGTDGYQLFVPPQFYKYLHALTGGGGVLLDGSGGRLIAN